VTLILTDQYLSVPHNLVTLILSDQYLKYLYHIIVVSSVVLSFTVIWFFSDVFAFLLSVDINLGQSFLFLYCYFIFDIGWWCITGGKRNTSKNFAHQVTKHCFHCTHYCHTLHHVLIEVSMLICCYTSSSYVKNEVTVKE
jgi:hypothetical protein